MLGEVTITKGYNAKLSEELRVQLGEVTKDKLSEGEFC
jgi:hypothetical protein